MGRGPVCGITTRRTVGPGAAAAAAAETIVVSSVFIAVVAPSATAGVDERSVGAPADSVTTGFSASADESSGLIVAEAACVGCLIATGDTAMA